MKPVQLLTILMIFVNVCKSDQGPLCYSSQTDFANACSNLYKGIVNGGRCFFSINIFVNWSEAWQQCASQGGTLAQIHTNSEMLAITNYLQTIYGDTSGAWIAMQKTVAYNAILSPCFIDVQNTYWYTSPTTYDPLWKAQNTWSRNRKTDDCHNAGYCGVVWDSYTKLGDWYCTNLDRPLCEVTNLNQHYTLFPNTCIAEQVMATFSSSNVTDCASKCDTYSWCRSFNFRSDTSACDFFPWTARDGPNIAPAANCVNYSYDP